MNSIDGVIISMLTSSVVDHGSSPVRSNQRLQNWYLLPLHKIVCSTIFKE